MNTLAFVLECAAIVAVVGGAGSLLVWPLLKVLAGSHRPSPALRGELVFLLGGLPAAAAITAVLAAAAPSLAALVAGTADHCAEHAHHLHLCLVHAAGLRPPVAAVGAIFLAVLAFRGATRLASWRQEAALLTALEALGRRSEGRFPVVTVPGSPWLCLAAGLLRRRIILSATLQDRLAPQELASALAHERAHLVRRDPLANVVLSLAGLLAFPFVARLAASAYRSASEEASDAVSAQEVGDAAVVANALLKVASCRRPMDPLQATAAFGAHALERRVVRLLALEGPARRTNWALGAMAALSVTLLGAGLLHSGTLHHSVETLLHHLS